MESTTEFEFRQEITLSFLSLSFLIHDPRTPTSEWVVLSTDWSSLLQDQPKRGFQPHPLGPPSFTFFPTSGAILPNTRVFHLCVLAPAVPSA